MRFVKIGFSTNLGARMLDLQGGNPRDIRLVGKFPAYQASETTIHKHFQHLRIRREWFKFSTEIDDLLDDIVDYQIWNGVVHKANYVLLQPTEVEALLRGGAPWMGVQHDAA